MPPKRHGPPAKAPPAKRPSKLARENGLTAEQETEIREAFGLFAVSHPEHKDPKDGVLKKSDVRRCLISLNLTPDKSEMSSILSTIDPLNTGYVEFVPFLSYAAIAIHSKEHGSDGDEEDDEHQAESNAEEVSAAYHLFTHGARGPITLGHLRRVAKELREDVPDDVLKDMILEANGGVKGQSKDVGGVSLEDFETQLNDRALNRGPFSPLVSPSSMSSGVEVPGSQRRPGIWSYFSFSGPRRRVSVSLPRNFDPNRADASDPNAKADRHSRHRSTYSDAFMNDHKGSAVMNQGQRLRYLKTGGVIALILLILYFVAPRDGISRPAVSHPSGGNTAAGDAKAQCTKSYSKDKPLIQYALMVDAGSTGSRIHVYKFNNCGPSPELESENFEMTPKREGGSGLSAYGDDPEAAAKSLDVLMDVALKNVPKEYQSCTPIAVKATAGLRKLGEEKSNAILAAVRKHLDNDYPFPLVSEENNGVEVMPGEMEGVYAWITVNYLLGKIGGPDKNPTAAVLDLGGGSTQIIFEPTFPDTPRGGLPTKLAEGDHKYTLNFGNRNFDLYQHSYLGYGLMEARNNLHSTVLAGLHETNKDNREYLKKPIVNPCIAPGMTREIEVQMPKGHALGDSITVNMTGPSTASPTQCRGLAEKTLHKDDECAIAPCAFRGVHQPPFEQTFATEAVYLLSYFYDRTQDLGMPESFTLRELQNLADKVCTGEKGWDSFSAVPNALEELKGRPEWCLDLNFQYELLRSGYGMPIDREVKIAKKIKGNELGWCLGASLPLLEANSGWQCKIKQVQ
ncbi:guanosine-diphosphatase [Alternaria panax]|uniref:guanosine-diphosphatase n=1 Tax=Alternaria panax TaxID=48097 RepID=A0AAD4NQ22_9PLEO|nr:guanosine-diphosphatase [Alternaria panax]